jgi:hypothetical protein
MNTQAIRCLTVLIALATPVGAQPLMYVDLHPLAMRDVAVEDSTVEWQKIATAVVENRSGLTLAANVVATASCTAGGDLIPPVSQHLGNIPPRQSLVVQIPVDIPVAPSFYEHRVNRAERYLYRNKVEVGTVRCKVYVTYQAVIPTQ